MLTFKNHLPTSVLTTLLFLAFSSFGQQPQYLNSSFTSNAQVFPNPILLDENVRCSFENLNQARFDRQITAKQQLRFCEIFREISIKLNGNWSPALKYEMQQIWQVFIRENVKIRPMNDGVDSNIKAMAESFTKNTNSREFSANLYLRDEQIGNKAFFTILMHELRHIFDLYGLWKNKTYMTEAELEKRAFRLVGKINRELPERDRVSGNPNFWEDSWKYLPLYEIERRREEKIEKFMRSSPVYKHLMMNPQKYLVGYLANQTSAETVNANLRENDGERLPNRLKIRQSDSELPQQVKEVSFKLEKAANPTNPDELLRAALKNEKNLYQKMDNFVYDQNLQLQCWKKQKVTENYEMNRLITRTQNGETLFQNENVVSSSAKTSLPSCVLDLNAIKSDATETFWSAPYLDEMVIKFNSFAVIDGISVARYTVYEPTADKFNRMASLYPNIKPFRSFVGTIFVSVADSQIIKFWGTSFPESQATGKKPTKTYGSYGTTAVRQKLASGIWVTTLLNAVAVTYQNNKMKPFSYVVKYLNYRQGTTDVKILDDEEIASK